RRGRRAPEGGTEAARHRRALANRLSDQEKRGGGERRDCLHERLRHDPCRAAAAHVCRRERPIRRPEGHTERSPEQRQQRGEQRFARAPRSRIVKDPDREHQVEEEVRREADAQHPLGFYRRPSTIPSVLATGTLLDGKYAIRGRLAGGGMGEVYLAHRTLLGDDVAVKIIRPAGPDPAVWRSPFLRESRACAQLRHPNIVTILDYNADDPDQPYLVMEYLNGPSLAEELRARGTFDLGTVQHVMRSGGSALNMAHANGMVHRDLKPQNVVSHRFESGEVVHKVIDFGLVNAATGEHPLTEAHEFLGTVAYASPEQFSGETTSVFSDQYSLGVIIYELLAGVGPIQGDGFLVLVDQHLNASPVPLGERRPDLPVGAVSAVMRALAKNPRDRWPSIAALVQALGEDDENPTVAVSMPRPSLLGIYELGPVIAQGRFGSEIHSGTHRALGIPVAIRIFRTLTHDDREAVRSRFLKEARALQVPHPNLIHVRDFGEDGDLLYVVTDLLEGCSLAERLSRDGPLPLPLLDAFVRQGADATAP